MPVLETDVERRFCRWLVLHMFVPLKLNVKGRRGFPDRLIFGPGPTFYFIEFKRPGGTTSKLQDYRIKQLRRWGFNVYVCESFEEAVHAHNTQVGAA